MRLFVASSFYKFQQFYDNIHCTVELGRLFIVGWVGLLEWVRIPCI
jgi:hypothetical protein